jgi:hypothetical protein
MSSWFVYNAGQTIGSVGAEGGEILRDEVHKGGVRVTLKRGSKYISVSCKVYGWMDHTRFFSSVTEAQREYLLMKPSLAHMVENISTTSGSDLNLKMWEAIAEFVRRFP